MNIELLLVTSYPLEHDRKHVVTLFSKYDLHELAQAVIREMDKLCEKYIDTLTDRIDTDALILATAPMLKEINSRVGPIENHSEKFFVKAALGKLLQGELKKKVIGHMTRPDFDRWINAIRIYYEQQDLNFEDLWNFLGLEEISHAIPEEAVGVTFKPPATVKPVYLVWKMNPNLKKHLADKLQRKDYIKSTREFLSLFDPDGVGAIRFNRKFLSEIFVLFSQMHKEKRIGGKGSRGIWHIIASRAVDFDGNKLITELPKRIQERLESNAETYNALVGKSTSFLSTFA